MLKNLPRLVLELESKRNKEEFEQHMLNKHLYGQPLSRKRRDLTHWIDGKVITGLKEQIAELQSQLELAEQSLEELKIKKKNKLIS